MAVTREQAVIALFTLLSGTGGFKTVGRRNRAPATIAVEDTPALMLVEHMEKYERQSPSLPPQRILSISAIIYNDAGQDENVIPSSVINILLDGIDAALVPDNPILGRNTLGGLVYSAMIDGDIIKAPGDVTGKGLAIIPIKVILP